MRPVQSPSIDFNQMLVVSVFFHFLFFTTVMFLPQTQEAVRRIKPAFMVSLVNIPAGPDIQSAPPAKPVPVAPAPPVKPVPKPITQSIPEPKPKPIPVPEKPAASKALVSKLDELARLEKKKTIPKKDKLAMAVPKPLEDIESLKMKTAVEKKKKSISKKDEKKELTLEEKRFQELSEKSPTQKSQDKPEKKSDLLKDLDELAQLNKQDDAALSKPKIKQTDSKAAELLKQLESIKNESVQIKIDTSKLSPRHSQKFKSGIRNLNVGKKFSALAASGEPGDPGADALSKHVGEVYLKVFKNWKDPLGGGTGMVQVSFTIFPKGNISTPEIVKSSGDSKLDNLAILAVKNAEPLPPFPKEIREPNLPFILEFTYETSKN